MRPLPSKLESANDMRVPSVSGHGPHGHRARMRTRILTDGASILTDFEILEMLFFWGEKRGDVQPLAKATIELFGSLGAVLTANREALKASPGITTAHSDAIELVKLAATALSHGVERLGPVLSDPTALRQYLATGLQSGLRVLYLNGGNALLDDESGVKQELEMPDMRDILRRALEVNAVSLLLAFWRSHPFPTEVDRCLLLALKITAARVGVTVHDFVIVYAGRVISVRESY